MKLHGDAKTFYDDLIGEYGISDPAGLRLAQTAAEAMSRMRNCQASIEELGELMTDRSGGYKQHPLIPAERDARAAMLSALKALNLDVEPLKEPGRPPTLYEVSDAN